MRGLTLPVKLAVSRVLRTRSRCSSTVSSRSTMSGSTSRAISSRSTLVFVSSLVGFNGIYSASTRISLTRESSLFDQSRRRQLPLGPDARLVDQLLRIHPRLRFRHDFHYPPRDGPHSAKREMGVYTDLQLHGLEQRWTCIYDWIFASWLHVYWM